MPSAPPLVAVLVPDPADPAYANRWPEAFARYEAVFAAEGARAVPVAWTEGPHPDAEVHVASLAWGYHFEVERWLKRLAAWPRDRTLVNPPELLAWNTRKTYLAGLERAGVPVIPTAFVDHADAAAIRAAAERFGTDQLVVKPQVSAGSHATARLDARDPEAVAGAALLGPAMIQPFLESVGEEGELSLFFFAGRFSHAAAKRAAPGDFRVQPQFGGAFRTLEPDAEALAVARAALAAAPVPPVYARCDMVRDGEGRLRLMELEAIEPDLYFDHAADGGAAFARAVLAAG